MLQQSRVQIDADWNEQMQIISERFQTEARDVIGSSGAPEQTGGFELAVHPAIEFTQAGQRVAVDRSEYLSFPEREKFTFQVRLNPSSKQGGPILSQVAKGDLGGYWLQMEPDGRLSFHRVERRWVEGTETVINEATLGDVEVIAIKQSEVAVDTRFRRVVYSHFPIDLHRFSDVAVTFDGVRLKMYVDGELTALRHCGPAIAAHEPLFIGWKGSSGAGASFEGAIGSVRVWHTASSESELRARSYGVEDHLHGHLQLLLPFDDGEGDIARDESGHSRNGRLEAHNGPLPSWSRTLWLKRGRYYVDGITCENDEDMLVNDQSISQFPKPNISWHRKERFLAYLEIFEQLINAIQDPYIRDVALGGTDTAVRVQTLWQLKLLPLKNEDATPGHYTDIPAWRQLMSTFHRSALLARAGLRITANQLYRVEVHTGTLRAEGTADPSNGRLQVSTWPAGADTWKPGDLIEVHQPASKNPILPVARINAVDEEQRILYIDPWAAPTDLIRHLSIRRIPTFKWSRNNGSITLPLVDRSSSQVTVDRKTGADSALEVGDWMEVSDDRTMLSENPAPLCRIQEVSRAPSGVAVTLTNLGLSSVTGDSALHPLLRRWDQRNPIADPDTGVITARPETWIELENGIEVLFQAGLNLKSRDYWTIPTRSQTGTIEWPHTPEGPRALLPHGPRRAICGLALLSLDGHGPTILEDYHQTFAPLTRIRPERPSSSARDLTFSPEEVPQNEDVTLEPPIAPSPGEPPAPINHVPDLEPYQEFQPDQLHPGSPPSDFIPDTALPRPDRDHAIALEATTPAVPGLHLNGCVLRESNDPVPGHQFTGAQFFAFDPDSTYAVASNPPLLHGVVSAVACDGLVYMLSESGELYSFSPRNGQYVHCESMPQSRRNFAFAATGGRLYVVGGQSENRGATPPTLIYDAGLGKWTTAAPLNTAREGLCAVALGERVHALGGRKLHSVGSFWTPVHEVFDPQTDRWTAGKPMRRTRSGFAASQLKGRLYVAGGWIPSLGGAPGKLRTASCDEYDPTSNEWLQRSPMPAAFGQIAMQSFAGRLVVVGVKGRRFEGGSAAQTSAAIEFLPDQDLWRRLQPVRLPQGGVNLAAVENNLYAVRKDGSRASQGALVRPLADVYYIFRKLPEGAQ